METKSKTVNQSFDGLEIVSERPEEAVLEEVESGLRKKVKSRGLETVGDKDAAIQFSEPSHQVESEEDLLRYLDHSAGLQDVELVVYASGHRGNKELGEKTEAHISLDPEGFVEAYNALEESLDVKTAGLNVSGYGEDLVEAYRSAVPMVSFLLDGEAGAGVTVSYRNGGTVETIWSDSEERFREVYDALFGLGLDYEGSVLEGAEEAEWMIADDGFAYLDEER